MLQAIDTSSNREIVNIAYLRYTMNNKTFKLKTNRVVDIIENYTNLRIKLTKSAITSSNSSTEVYKGEIIHYKIIVELIGNRPLNNIIFKDMIPKGTKYIQNSLKLNNNIVNGYKDRLIEVEIIKIINTYPKHTIEFDVILT